MAEMIHAMHSLGLSCILQRHHHSLYYQVQGQGQGAGKAIFVEARPRPWRELMHVHQLFMLGMRHSIAEGVELTY